MLITVATMPPAASRPRPMPALRDDRHQLIAVDDIALLVDDDDAIGVAVERDADVGPEFLDLVDERLRRRRTAVEVDVVAVRLDADLDHLGAEFPERFRRHLVGCAVGAIDDDAERRKAQVLGQRALGEFDIAFLRAFDSRGAADAIGVDEQGLRVGVDQILDLPLHVVGKLVAVRIEELDAVVVRRVVGSRQHHAEVGAQRPRQHRNRWRRHRTEQEDVHADRGEARHQRRFQHVARKPRVLADDDAVAMSAGAEHGSRRHTDLQRNLRRHRMPVGETANAVCPEIAACHVDLPSCEIRTRAKTESGPSTAVFDAYRSPRSCHRAIDERTQIPHSTSSLNWLFSTIFHSLQLYS